MVKKLVKHGNSLALLIEKGVLDLLKIDTDTSLDITTDGDVLIVSPIRKQDNSKKFKCALEKANKQYGHMLKRLAE